MQKSDPDPFKKSDSDPLKKSGSDPLKNQIGSSTLVFTGPDLRGIITTMMSMVIQELGSTASYFCARNEIGNLIPSKNIGLSLESRIVMAIFSYLITCAKNCYSSTLYLNSHGDVLYFRVFVRQGGLYFITMYLLPAIEFLAGEPVLSRE